MANIGLRHFKYAILNSDGITYGPVKTLSGAIECKPSIENDNVKLYADDKIKEEITAFKGGTLTLGIANDDDNVFSELLGKTIDPQTKVVTSNVNDKPPYVGFGHIVVIYVDGVKKYKAEFLAKTKFKPFMADSKSKGESFEFTTPSVEVTIFEPDDGNWEKHGVYSSESAANAALEAFFVQSTVTLAITTQPQDVTVTEGAITESLSVTASASSGTITYQWYENTTNSNVGGSAITSTTSAYYAIPTTLETTDSPKYYYCVVGSASAPSIVSNVAKVTIEA